MAGVLMDRRNQCPLLGMYRSSVVGNTGGTAVHLPRERMLVYRLSVERGVCQ